MKNRIFCLRFIIIVTTLLFVARRVNAQATHTLKATPKTVAWGYYDAKATPVLRVKSGDSVEIQTLITNSPERLEKAGVPFAIATQMNVTLSADHRAIDGAVGAELIGAFRTYIEHPVMMIV